MPNRAISLQTRIIKNLELGLSAFIVIIVGIVYGFNPSEILPIVFGFEVQDLELQNIFRAMMGLYMAFASFWIFGIVKPKYWRTATMSNVTFMGGLAFGRILSTIIDGTSPQFIIGLAMELIFAFWGLYNLNISTK